VAKGERKRKKDKTKSDEKRLSEKKGGGGGYLGNLVPTLEVLTAKGLILPKTTEEDQH